MSKIAHHELFPAEESESNSAPKHHLIRPIGSRRKSRFSIRCAARKPLLVPRAARPSWCAAPVSEQVELIKLNAHVDCQATFNSTSRVVLVALEGLSIVCRPTSKLGASCVCLRLVSAVLSLTLTTLAADSRWRFLRGGSVAQASVGQAAAT